MKTKKHNNKKLPFLLFPFYLSPFSFYFSVRLTRGEFVDLARWSRTLCAPDPRRKLSAPGVRGLHSPSAGFTRSPRIRLLGGQALGTQRRTEAEVIGASLCLTISLGKQRRDERATAVWAGRGLWVETGAQAPLRPLLGRSTRSRLCSSPTASSPSPSSTTSPSRGPRARTPAAGATPLVWGASRPR